ncbi:MAG: PhoH family protein [Planctomycetota bacterium]|nr:PhoH family protein [Planctomycetota bacterium]
MPSGSERVRVLGPAERTLKLLREALGVNVSARDGRVHVTGDRAPVLVARNVLEELSSSALRGEEMPTRQRVLDLISGETEAIGDGNEPIGSVDAWDGKLHVYAAGRPVRAQTPNQEAYLDAIRGNDLVFAIGPAGTGKTYLAVAAAVHLLKTGRVKRVILARPAVEAGEKLGFLPGDLRAKVNPYLRPLFDALADMMDYATLRRFMENDVVEVSPLAFMRGRTLNNAVIILDEAQNSTKGQMKMFLTRLGHGSRMIVTGDATQIDLPDPTDSGLIDAARRLARTPGVGFVTFGRADVVRHNLVQRIIDAYGDEDDRPPPSHVRRPGARPPRRPDNPEADAGVASMDDRTLTEPDRSGTGHA